MAASVAKVGTKGIYQPKYIVLDYMGYHYYTLNKVEHVVKSFSQNLDGAWW